jgi:glycosyltransferase involved in cell wall biosynthesis
MSASTITGSSDKAGHPTECSSEDLGALFEHTIVLATTTRSKGGVWRHVCDLAELLRASGLQVVIGLSPDAEEMHRDAEEKSLAWRPLRSTVRIPRSIWHVHLADTYDLEALTLLALRAPFGPSVITEHLPRNHASDSRLEPQHRRRRGASAAKTALKRLEFGLCDAVIAVGNSSASFLRSRYRLRPDAVTVVYNGVAQLPEPPRPDPGGRPLEVLAIGSLGRQKGFDVLIEAVSQSRSDWRLTVAGAGFQQENLSDQAAAVDGARISFPGWVESVDSLILGADVLCMPSRWESFPYTALEAMSLRRPVVGSHVDGLDEIVTEQSGVLVEPERPDHLATVLDSLAADPSRVARLADGTRAQAARFSLGRMLRGTLDVYAHVLGSRITDAKSSHWR